MEYEIPTERKWPTWHVLLAVEGDLQGGGLWLRPVKTPSWTLAVDVVGRVWCPRTSKWICDDLCIGDFYFGPEGVSAGWGGVSIEHLHVVASKICRNKHLSLDVSGGLVDQRVGDDRISVIKQLDLILSKFVALHGSVDVDGVPVDDFRVIRVFDIVSSE